jgi:hypothetical protein
MIHDDDLLGRDPNEVVEPALRAMVAAAACSQEHWPKLEPRRLA